MGVRNFEDYAGNYEYSPGGRNFGHPMLNAVMGLMLGSNYMPSPGQGESMSDAFHKKQRTIDSMGLQRSSFANSQLFKQLGVQDNPMLHMLGQFAGSPDSLAGRIMSPILGGNPMAASMRMYAGMGGAQALNTFGRTAAISGEETEGIMHALSRNMYKSEQYEGANGGRQRMIKENREMFLDMSKNTKGRKNLEDMFDIKLDTDASGNITEKSRKELESLDITSGEALPGMTSKGNKLANDLEGRGIAAGDLSAQLSKTIEKRNKAIAEAKKKNDKITEDQLAQIVEKEEKDFKEKLNKQAKFSGAEIAAMSTNGALDTDKVGKALQDFTRPNIAEERYLEAKRKQEAGSSFRGYDFAKSRGFKLEDFSSAFVESSKQGMLGNRKGQSIASTMSDFSEHAGGALDAARSIFGKDKSGAELVKAISDMSGNSVDLGTAAGAKESEDLLRRTKVTAKAAGMSIKSMLGIIDSVKELAAQNPQLQHTSGAGTTELAVGAVQRSAYRASGMTAADLRAAGGMQGLVSSDVAATNDFNQSSLGSGMIALLSSVSGDDKKTKYLQELMSSGKFNQKALDQGLMSDIAKNLGKSETEAQSIYQNTLMGRQGLKIDSVAKFMNSGVAQKITSATLAQGIEDYTDKNMDQIAKEAKEFMKKPGATLEQFMATNIMPLFDDEESHAAYEKYGSDYKAAIEDKMRSPEEKERYDTHLKHMQQVETDMAKKYAGANAAPTTQLIGAVAENRGGTTADMVSGITSLFATPGMSQAGQQAAKNIAALSGSKELEEQAGENINAIIKARKSRATNEIQEGYRTGKTASNEAYRLHSELGEVDVDELADAGKLLANNPLTRNAKDARARLKELEEQESSGTLRDENKSTLDALRKFNKADLLQEDNVFNLGKKGTKSGAAAAVLQTEVNYQQKQQLEEFEKKGDQDLGFQLEEKAKKEEEAGGGMSKTREALKAYGYDTKKLREDFNRGVGQFADEQFRKDFGESGGGKLVNSATDMLTHTKQAYEEQLSGGKLSPEAQQHQDLINQIKELTGAILGGGKIGEALSSLAGQLI